MLKTYMKLLIITIITICFPLSSYAYTAEDIAGKSDLLYVSGSTIYSKPTTMEQFWNEYECAVTNTLNACDAMEAGEVRWELTPKGYRFKITANQVNTLIKHQEYTDQWIAATVPSIIPQGMNRETAIRTVYDWILENYYYSFEITRSTLSLEKYQGAYQMISTNDKGGICASYSKLFRAMLEYIPFNEAGLVDCSAANPSHINVAIISNSALTHEWNAIRDPDGRCYYYDLSAQAILSEICQETGSDADRDQYFRISESTISQDPAYGNPGSFIFNR